MGDDGADPTTDAANDERRQVEALQSEFFRKQEQLERLRQRSHALDDELQLREAELIAIKRKLEVEHHSAKRGATEDKARTESAEDDYLKVQVQRLLSDRVPLMSALLDEGNEEADMLAKEQTTKQVEPNNEKQEKVHDTVLVSYVQSRESWESRQEDYKVSYRIDSHTTVEQLHRDACAYWGCSRKDYKLFKVNQMTNEIRCLSDDPSKGSKKLQDPSVLSATEQAHLHLCNHQRRLEEIHAARQREREREIKQMQANKPSGNHGKPLDMLMTLRFGLGLAVAERQAEEFVDAFAPWPGMQHMLRSRDADNSQKWRNTHCSDLFCFALLAFFTALCFSYRSSTDLYLVRESVMRALNEGSPGQSSLQTPLPFLLYGWPDDPWADATPGVVWENGTLFFEEGGPQSVRSVWPLPEYTWGVEVTASFEPDFQPVLNCSEYSVQLASTDDGAPMLQAIWGCESVSLFSPSDNITQACALNDSYALQLILTLDGAIQFRAGDGCEAVLRPSYWGVLGVMRLYLTLGADSEHGTSGFGMLALAVTRAAEVRTFKNIHTHRHIKEWLGGSFHYQVFDNRSTLREHYAPVGFLRIRQQRAANRECERELGFGHVTVKTCQYAHAVRGTEEREPLSSHDRDTVEALANLSAPPLKGTPTLWTDAAPGQTSLSGRLQSSYNGGGYSLDVPLADLEASGRRFQEVLDVLCDTWLSADTRLLALELVLENKAISGHVVASFFLEIGASGAVMPITEVQPVHLRETPDDLAANTIDIVRWLLVLGYLGLSHVWNEAQSQLDQGRSCMAFFVSLGGILDIACAGFFFAVQAALFRRRPPDPKHLTEFRSYSSFAYDVDRLVIFEAMLFLLLLLRYATFLRFAPEIYRFFRVFSKSLIMFGYYLAVAGPVFFGALFLALSIYSSREPKFATWGDAASTLVLGLSESFHLEGMFLASPTWTIFFALYFTLALVVFLMSGFLAIVVHAYFETEIVDKPEMTEEPWTRDSWLQWMLWERVYERLKRVEKEADENEGDDEEADDSSSDEEPTEQKPR